MKSRYLLITILLSFYTAHSALADFPNDFSNVIMEATGDASNIQSFAVTANLDFSVTAAPISSYGRGLILDSNKSSVWRSGSGSVSCCNANAWIFAKFGNQWYGHTFEFIRFGQTVKSEAALGRSHFKGTPPWATSFTPTTGAVYGFMVAGMTRNGPSQVNVRERSNIDFWRWNVGPATAEEATGAGAPPPAAVVIPMAPIITELLDEPAAPPPPM